jgi:hypothetical protein
MEAGEGGPEREVSSEETVSHIEEDAVHAHLTE